MRDSSPRGRIALVFAAALLVSGLDGMALAASQLSLDNKDAVTIEQGAPVTLKLTGAAGKPAWLLIDIAPGPTNAYGQQLPIGFSPFVLVLPLGAIPPSGEISFTAAVPTLPGIQGQLNYMLGIVQDDAAQFGLDFSNGATLEIGDGRVELAGNPLAAYPHFEFVKAFNTGEPISLGLDPTRYPSLIGKNVRIFVVDSKSASEWDSDPALVDASGAGSTPFTFQGGSILNNIVTINTGTFTGNAGTDVGVGYDVVIDVNKNGVYDAGDFIDGYGDEAGLYVVRDLTLPGPYAVTETTYSGGSFLGQNTYYPSNIASLGKLPLVVVSHGNGHQYTWYDHIGNHLASYGYVVMSHQNNTQPGTLTASTTTLTNTDYIIGNQATIAGGVLSGHIDSSRITWIGHSRGGEGVVRAYHRIWNGSYTPANFTLSDIRLVSSIAPTDFGGVSNTHPHGVIYHLWTGIADADVNGCASSNVGQTFHLHDRAENIRQSIALHGVGHGDFHDGGGGSVASGPCLVGRVNTHTIMRGYLLPLVKRYIEGNIPSEDFLWRQWESFHPVGAPTSSCVSVDLMYREAETGNKIIIDDFQTNSLVTQSSSGGAVTGTVTALREGRYDDGNTSFTHDTSDIMNSVTLGSGSDTTRGGIFEFDNVDADLTFEVPVALRDLRDTKKLSFRAAQASRHPLTTAAIADLDFEVTLRDSSGTTSTIAISAFGGGVEEPYQRSSCGSGIGWAAEFETIRLPVEGFLTDGSGLNLCDIDAIIFEFGPSHGAAQGRVAIDQIEFTRD